MFYNLLSIFSVEGEGDIEKLDVLDYPLNVVFGLTSKRGVCKFFLLCSLTTSCSMISAAH
jgi:hypothetical protein